MMRSFEETSGDTQSSNRQFRIESAACRVGNRVTVSIARRAGHILGQKSTVTEHADKAQLADQNDRCERQSAIALDGKKAATRPIGISTGTGRSGS